MWWVEVTVIDQFHSTTLGQTFLKSKTFGARSRSATDSFREALDTGGALSAVTVIIGASAELERSNRASAAARPSTIKHPVLKRKFAVSINDYKGS